MRNLNLSLTDQLLKDTSLLQEELPDYVQHPRIPTLYYNPKQGDFKRKRANGSILRINPDEHGRIVYTCPDTGERVCTKAIRLAWEAFNSRELQEDEYLIFRDSITESTDLSIGNITKLNKDDYSELSIAMQNLTGSLRLVKHEKDAYCYYVHWRDTSSRKKLFHDIVSAKKFIRRLLLLNTKVLGKYIRSE